MRARVLLTVLISFTASSAAAQVGGVPVHNAGPSGGVTLALDVGYPNQEAGEGHATGLSAEFKLGPVGLTPFLSWYSPQPSYLHGENWKGVAASVQLIPGPVHLTAQAGIASGARRQGGLENIRYTMIPIGLGVSTRVPLGGLSLTPWFAPRLQLINTSGGADAHDDFYAFSGGVDLGLPARFQLRAAYDQINSNDGPTSVFSFGVGYALSRGPWSSR